MTLTKKTFVPENNIVENKRKKTKKNTYKIKNYLSYNVVNVTERSIFSILFFKESVLGVS